MRNLSILITFSVLFVSCSLMKAHFTDDEYIENSRVKNSSFSVKGKFSSIATKVLKAAKNCYNGKYAITDYQSGGAGGTTNHVFTVEMVKNTSSLKRISIRQKMYTSMHDYNYPVAVIEISQKRSNTLAKVYYGEEKLFKAIKLWANGKKSTCPKKFGIR